MNKFVKKIISRVVVMILMLSVLPYTVQAALPVEEFSLNPAGDAYEINSDSQGWLWLSDYVAREVWAFNPAGNAYNIYPVGGAPSDARRVSTDLWWVDGKSGEIGRASTLTGTYTRWVGPAGKGLFGTAIDANGRLWASGVDPGFVYRFDPAGPTICSYAIPDEGETGYLISEGGVNIWFGDISNARLMRLNSNSGVLTWWSLPANANPYSLTRDGDGHIWYADMIRGELAELILTPLKIHRYPIPGGGSPWMLSTSEDLVWFTDQIFKTTGYLNQKTAAKLEFTPTAAPDATIIPACAAATISESGSYPWPLASHTMTGVAAEYSVKTDQPGWKILQLPTADLPAAVPWGITTQGGNSWVVDYGRQKLVKVSESIAYEPSLVLSKNANPLTYDSIGDVIQYEYLLTNSGNVTLTGPFTVTDDRTANETCPAAPASLEVGQSITCTASYSITQADLDAGSVTNLAAGHAWFNSSQVHSTADAETVTAVQSPALTIVKMASPTSYQSAGDMISYSYTLSNSGNVTLVGPFTVTDDKATPICPVTALLAPGASITCTATYSITLADITAGYVTNTASGHGFFGADPISSIPVDATVTMGSTEYEVFLPLIKR